MFGMLGCNPGMRNEIQTRGANDLRTMAMALYLHALVWVISYSVAGERDHCGDGRLEATAAAATTASERVVVLVSWSLVLVRLLRCAVLPLRRPHSSGVWTTRSSKQQAAQPSDRRRRRRRAARVARRPVQGGSTKRVDSCGALLDTRSRSWTNLDVYSPSGPAVV